MAVTGNTPEEERQYRPGRPTPLSPAMSGMVPDPFPSRGREGIRTPSLSAPGRSSQLHLCLCFGSFRKPYHFIPKKSETILSYHNQNRWNFKMQTVRISEGKGTYSGRKKRVSRCVQAGWVISLQGGMKPDLCSFRTANAEKAGIPLFTVTLCPVFPLQISDSPSRLSWNRPYALSGPGPKASVRLIPPARVPRGAEEAAAASSGLFSIRPRLFRHPLRQEPDPHLCFGVLRPPGAECIRQAAGSPLRPVTEIQRETCNRRCCPCFDLDMGYTSS